MSYHLGSTLGGLSCYLVFYLWFSEDSDVKTLFNTDRRSFWFCVYFLPLFLFVPCALGQHFAAAYLSRGLRLAAERELFGLSKLVTLFGGIFCILLLPF